MFNLLFQKSGVYIINLTHGTDVSAFEITDASGRVLELAINKNTGKYLGSDPKNNQIAVILEPGTTYHLIGYYSTTPGGTATYSIQKSRQLSLDDADDSGYASTRISAPNITDDYGTKGLKITGRDAAGKTGGNTGGNTGGGNTGSGTTGGGNTGGSTTPTYNAPQEDHTKRDNEQRVNFVQRAITWLFVRGLADQFKAFIVMLFGDVTIDKILFNEYSGTKLAFYKENGRGDKDRQNDFLENGENSLGILNMVDKFYIIFRGIAILFYIAFLGYIGIRIILISTAKEKEKYKAMLINWFKGAILLFYFPYVIKYTIILNEALVGLVAEVKNGNTELSEYAQVVTPRITNSSEGLLKAMGAVDTNDDKDLMMTYRNMALDTGNLVNALIYLFLLKELLGFILVYYKRVIMVLFLIVMFPFVCITYALDKIKDGQAQIFASWVKEFLLNIFLQFFQAMVYVAVMFIIAALMGQNGNVSGANILLTVIALRYIAKSDELLRALFPSILQGGQGGTVKPLSAAVQKMTDIKMIQQAGRTVSAMGSRFTNAKDKYLDYREQMYEYRAEANRVDEQRRGEEAYQRRVNEANVSRDINLASAAIPALPAFATRAAVDARKAAMDKKMQSLDDLAFARSNDSLRGEYDAYMASKTDAERQEIEQQIDAKESINEVLTGRDRSGRKLTDQELSVRAKVVVDVIRAGRTGGSRGYKELNEWMESKSIAVKEKVYAGGITVEQGKKLEAAGAKPKFRTSERQVRLSDYLDADSSSSVMQDVKTGKATTLRKGMGLAGRIVDAEDSAKLEQASRFVGGAAGVKTTKTDDITTSYDDTTKRTKLDDADALRLDSLSSAASDKISMSDDELFDLWNAHKGDVESIVAEYGSGASSSERGEIQEAAELLFQLQEYTNEVNARNADATLPPQAGVKTTEAYRISSRLNKLAANNEAVQRLLTDSVSDGTTVATRADVNVDLGFSLELLEAMSAQGVIHSNGALSKEDRKAYTQLAVESLSHDSEDNAVLAVQRRSENDDILGPNAPRQVGKEGKISRKGKTQEEIMEEVFEEEQEEDREKIASDALARARAKMIRAGIESAGATASATIGVTIENASGIALASMNAGTSDDLSIAGLVGSYNVGAGLEDFVEKAVPGTVNANAIGNGIAEGVETIGNIGVNHRQRKNFRNTGQEYDPNDPILVERVRTTRATNRTREISSRLKNI